MKKLLAALCAVSALVGFGETLRTAVNADPGYSFYTTSASGFYAWTADGENGVKSGGSGVSDVQSWTDVAIQGPATVTFEWKVSSESISYDWLACYDGASRVGKIGGTGGSWQPISYTITDSNVHLLKFAYCKDGSVNSGSDCGWVRNFKVTRATDLLPAEYIQYTSLKTDGNAAINSGYAYASGTRIDIEWALDATSSLVGGGGLSLPDGASTLTCKGSSAYFCNGSSAQVFSIGGTASGNSCPLFLLDKAGAMTPGDGEKIVGDIYSFRILDSNNVVQRNMIPCQRIADGAAGFYDTVGGVFYPSVTDAAFAAESRVGGYIITLDVQGGTGGTTGVKVLFGAEMPVIECPTKDGADFLGYFDENGTQYYDLTGCGVRTWDQDADVTLKARWDGDNTSLFIPQGEVGTAYVVSNLTTTTEVERYGVTADGLMVYRLPVRAKASVSCVPSAGGSVEGTNPYVIESVTERQTVDAAVLPRGVTPVQLALEAVFDTANTPTTVKQVRDENDALLGHIVTLGQNYGVLTIAEDLGAVTLDLNGWKISGSNGANGSDTTAGANGVAAITVSGTGCAAGATAITVANNTASAEGRPAPGSSAGIIGGNAGWGQPGGAGAYGIATASGAQYTGVSGSTSLITKGVNGRTIISVPSQEGTLTYTGYAQSPTWSSTANMSFGGTTSGIEVQTYTASVTPDSTHCWSGGSTVTKYINWTISEAVLPAATAQAKSQLEAIFDTAHTATTVKPLFTEGGELLGLRVILGKDYGPLTLPTDLGAVTFDLNGWTIKGASGTEGSGSTPGGEGGAAITVAGESGTAAGTTVITVINPTTAVGVRPARGSAAGIVGGNGGNSKDGSMPGNGGLAIVDADGAVYDKVVDTEGLVKKGPVGLLCGAVYDPTSDFVPTRIVNGDFAEEPWMDIEVYGVRYTRENRWDLSGNTTVDKHFPNGPGAGWNTTESRTYGQGLFEYINAYCGYAPYDSESHGYFIEMNANNNAVFYQDLYTHGGDVILWSLSHGTRSATGEQAIRVEVGAPNGQASGVGYEVNANIKDETKAVYTAEGVSNPSGIEYGYNGSLADLDMPIERKWGSAYGIYLIPEGQEVTRFAFISIKPSGSSLGNFLDDLTFSTIIGNLNAKANDDGSVSITGYWGDENLSKHLRIEFDGQTYDLDMSNIHSENFIVTIPHSLISETVLLSVYHEDYPLAKRTITVQHPNQFTVVADGTEFRAWCTNAAHSVETGCPHHGEENAVRLQFEATDRVYTGLPYDGISLTGDTNEWRAADLPLPTYTYAADGASEFGETPTGAGLYTVKATVKDVYGTDDFEITKAMLTVKADDKSVAVGDDAPAYTATVTGFVNGELAAAAYSGEPAFVCAYNKGDPVGSYSIEVALGTLESPNYGFDFAGGTLMVGNIKLTVDSVACGDPWRTITVNYTLDGVDPSTSYKIAFELSVDGETKAVTNETTLSNGPATKVIDTAGLFGEPGADPRAKVRVSLVAPVVFDECEFQLMPDSWQVGDGAYAFLDESGALFVFGTGATWDYSSLKQPWASSALKVKRTVVGNNVTEIGSRFYKKCYNMKSINCGSSVIRFRERAFYLCTSLEDIGVSNAAFDLDCLQDSIIYQMAYDANGKFIMVPSVEIAGCTPMLYGKRELSDPVWKRVGPLAGINLETLKADGVYHFFQTRLEK